MQYYSLFNSTVQRITTATFVYDVGSKVIAAMDALLNWPTAVEWHWLTLIVVQQTVILALGFSMLQCVSSLSCARHTSPHAWWCKEADSIIQIVLYVPPAHAHTDSIFLLLWLDFVQHEHRFLRRLIRNIYKADFSFVKLRNVLHKVP